MANRRIVGVINAVLIVAVLAPILLSVYLAHRKAEQVFHTELGHYADRAVMRTQKVLEQATEALLLINQVPDFNCSPAHLHAMRAVVLDNRYVQEVLFERSGHVLCSSLEEASKHEIVGKPDRIGEEGFKAWYTNTMNMGFQRKMVYIGKSPHIIAIDPLSFIDVIPYGTHPIQISMIGLYNNQIVASNGTMPSTIWETRIKQGQNSFQYENMAYEIRREDNLGVAMIAWTPITPLSVAWSQQLLLWLPIGIAFSLAAGWYITRLLQQLQSPQSRIIYAIKKREFTVMYQPIVDLQNGRCVGAEILVRWKQQDGSYLSPDIFIPLAEETGVITQITHQVIDKLFTETGEWLHKNPNQHISVNLAPCDIQDTTVLTAVRPYLEKYGVKPEQIAFEITERGFADPKVSAPIVEQFRRAGHPIYIDDFGTGYSSLSYLQNLDVDVLKIDKSFVDAIEYKKVTPYIIKMAKTLNIAMVAEGIETAGQASWLRKHGVQYGQGWLYSKALPKEMFLQWVESHQGK